MDGITRCLQRRFINNYREKVAYSTGLMRFRILLAFLLLASLYAGILGRLSYSWVHDPDLAQGFLIPLFVLAVLYRQRAQIQAVKSTPSWTGAAVVMLGLFVLSLGTLSLNLFLSRISFLLVLAGLVVLLQGWAFFRAVLFPWAVLALVIPIPALSGVRFTLFLESLSTKLAGLLVHLSGVWVPLKENVIMLPDVLVLICTGGSLLSLLAVAIMYGYFADRRPWLRVLLAIFVVPIQVVCGSFVIVTAALLAGYASSAKALEFIHISGWVSFILALFMLFILHCAIALIWKKRSAEPPVTFSQLKSAQG